MDASLIPRPLWNHTNVQSTCAQRLLLLFGAAVDVGHKIAKNVQTVETIKQHLTCIQIIKFAAAGFHIKSQLYVFLT